MFFEKKILKKILVFEHMASYSGPAVCTAE